MARLHTDEHLRTAIERHLRLLGHDVTPVRSFSQNPSGDGMPDEQVLRNASEHHAAVVTKNVKDFRALHKQSADHYGIIACTFRDNSDPKRIAKLIDDAIKNTGRLRGQFIRVNANLLA